MKQVFRPLVHEHQVVHLRYHTRHSDEVTERDIEPLDIRSWSRVLNEPIRVRPEKASFGRGRGFVFFAVLAIAALHLLAQ